QAVTERMIPSEETTRKYMIDYGFGRAELWTSVAPENAERRFYQLAGQCFGIRKSIAYCEILSNVEEPIPEPWSKLKGAYEVLKDSGGDTIVWDAQGEKVKSEWDY